MYITVVRGGPLPGAPITIDMINHSVFLIQQINPRPRCLPESGKEGDNMYSVCKLCFMVSRSLSESVPGGSVRVFRLVIVKEAVRGEPQ